MKEGVELLGLGFKQGGEYAREVRGDDGALHLEFTTPLPPQPFLVLSFIIEM